MLYVYRFSFCLSADENEFCFCLSARVAWQCASATNHLTNGTAEHFQCFCVCRYIFHTNRWTRLIQLGANCECSNLPWVLRLPRGPPGSWGVNALFFSGLQKGTGSWRLNNFSFKLHWISSSGPTWEPNFALPVPDATFNFAQENTEESSHPDANLCTDRAYSVPKNGWKWWKLYTLKCPMCISGSNRCT